MTWTYESLIGGLKRWTFDCGGIVATVELTGPGRMAYWWVSDDHEVLADGYSATVAGAQRSAERALHDQGVEVQP